MGHRCPVWRPVSEDGWARLVQFRTPGDWVPSNPLNASEVLRTLQPTDLLDEPSLAYSLCGGPKSRLTNANLDILHWRTEEKFTTMSVMEKHHFTGTVLRIEPNGFGIVQFDEPIGPSANSYGVFSTTLGSTAPYKELKPGVHVTGQAKPELDERKLATVETLRITLRRRRMPWHSM